jgi:hypothetical protein
MSTPPRWLYALNVVIIAILTFKVWACLASPSSLFGPDAWTPAATSGLRELAGRNLAMIAVSLAAFVRPRQFFPAVLVMGLVRETVDMILVPVNAGVSPATLGQAASFLLFLGAYLVGWRKMGHHP